MSDPRRALVMFGHLEHRTDAEAFGREDLHVQPGGVIDPAAEAARVVAGDLFARCGSLRVTNRLGRRRRWVRRQVVVGHAPRLVLMPWEAIPMAPPRYREHLSTPPWGWAVSLGLVLTLGMAFWIPLGAVAGILCLALGGALVVWLLVATAPTITVNERELRIGRVHIDADQIGLVATLDADATANARGANADPRAFTIMRPLYAKESVSLEILDAEDPHPYWLISSRDPQALGQAIQAAQRAALTVTTRATN